MSALSLCAVHLHKLSYCNRERVVKCAPTTQICKKQGVAYRGMVDSEVFFVVSYGSLVRYCVQSHLCNELYEKFQFGRALKMD